MFGSKVNTSLVVLVSSRQGCTEIANEVYSEVIQRFCVFLPIVGRQTYRLREDMQRGEVFVGCEKCDFGTGTVQGVQDINTG